MEIHPFISILITLKTLDTENEKTTMYSSNVFDDNKDALLPISHYQCSHLTLQSPLG